jgi:hypothetical protein
MRARVGEHDCIREHLLAVDGDAEHLVPDPRAVMQEQAKERAGEGIHDQLQVLDLRLARPEVVCLGVRDDGPPDPLGRVVHQELESRGAMIGRHEVGLGNAEHVHEPLHHDRVLREAIVVGETHLGVTEAEEIGSDDATIAGENGDHIAPLVCVERAAVEQNDWRTTPFIDVGHVPRPDGEVVLASRELLHRVLVGLGDERGADVRRRGVFGRALRCGR